MARVIWSPQALDDVEAIRVYIARDAPRSAGQFVRKIFETAERLQRFPLAGAFLPELQREDFRELHLKRYRIIYRVLTEDCVEIVTVYHGSRLGADPVPRHGVAMARALCHRTRPTWDLSLAARERRRS